MAPNSSSATPQQITVLLDFLDEHKDLARGRLRSIEGKVQAKRLWEELCDTLNSMGGCTKTIQQWQKVWFDRKHLAKKAAADSRRSASMTGGGPSVAPQLSEWTLKVLSIMGDGFGDRQTTARTRAFPEANEPVPSTSTSSQRSQQRSPVLPCPEEVGEYAEDPLAGPQSQESVITRRSLRSTRPTLRRVRPATDVRSRLYHYEDGRVERETVRNAELAGIRAAILQLCELMREQLYYIRQMQRP